MKDDIAGSVLVNIFISYILLKNSKFLKRKDGKTSAAAANKTVVGASSKVSNDVNMDSSLSSSNDSNENFTSSSDPTNFIRTTALHTYGIDNELYNTFKNYKEPAIVIRDMPDNAVDADSNMLQMRKQRGGREKRTIENKANRTADYFAHHFTDEMTRTERAPWWGRNEH